MYQMSNSQSCGMEKYFLCFIRGCKRDFGPEYLENQQKNLV